jgi:anhydro-N-acetylmuramic acid kinase
MSGSSLDGLDMALCHIDERDGIPEWTITAAQTVDFPQPLHQALFSAPSLSGFKLMRLDAEFGKFIGTATSNWIKANALKVNLIASHGHTVFHEPALGFTTQIGSGAHIAFASGIDTITSFRAADIAAGGQGAPFAPVADKSLFPGYNAYLNLGGIANISMVMPDGKWKGWDIGPCNQALNHLARKAGHAYDHDGQMASRGTVVAAIVDDLAAMFPFDGGRPKGLSNSEVQSSWIQYLDASSADVASLLASVTEAIAIMIHNHLHPLILADAKILVTGGGAFNAYLMERLRQMGPSGLTSFHLPAPEVINYKECLLMAWLGYLTMHHKGFGTKEVTGASKDTIGGAFFKAIQ